MQKKLKSLLTPLLDVDFDIDIFYNRVIIDAKSILGVLSMDLSQALTVSVLWHQSGF